MSLPRYYLNDLIGIVPLTLQVFSGDKYWRFDDAVGRVELDYPRDISMWRGVPSDVDAAFQYIDGKTYFFKVGLPEFGCGVLSPSTVWVF